MELQWSDSLSVGNQLMDTEHKTLLDMMAAVDRALRSGESLALSQAFQQLIVYVGIHCASEERLAQAVDLPFDNFKKLNTYLQAELEHMRLELDAKEGIWTEGAVEHFSHSLKNWVAAHIGRDARLLKPVFVGQPYELRP